jgi:cell division protein FtsI/penicillin-binding protein 2
MIGQGSISASPATMALVAAAVDSGTWRPLSVVTDPPPPAGGTAPTALRSSTDETLRRLMRAVVTNGTGTAADLPGQPVYGKTGTAEYGSGAHPSTHAWFIGFRGDIALAVLIEGGGVGGQVAAPVAARFLRSI